MADEPNWIAGTEGPDTVDGAFGPHLIEGLGGAGEDELDGRPGADVFDHGADDDTISGGDAVLIEFPAGEIAFNTPEITLGDGGDRWRWTSISAPARS